MKKWGKLEPGEKVKLRDIDPDATPDFRGSKAAAEQKRDKMRAELDDLQELMWAEHRRRLLIVLQGMDTAGKDGTIRYLMDGFNAASVRVASFKQPTAPELDHDFLWRIHQQVPGNGEIIIFNRSHYEDVLIVRVHELVPEDVWRKRYDEINDFERMLTETGTTILKFFLHISKDEQKERLQERVADPQKHWKFNAGDLEERKLWDEYQKAYEDAIEKTTTDYAPWYIIRANRKWYRNYVIGSVVIETMKKFGMKYPKVDLSKVVVE